MRHIREVLRLHYSVGMSQRGVARSLGLAQGTVSKYLNRSRRAGLTWPLPPELEDDVLLENRLYPPPSDLPSDERPQPDWAGVHRELRRTGVTLMLLWEEYCDPNSDSFSYSWFCERYKEWAGRLKPTLRQVHVAGEKLFVARQSQGRSGRPNRREMDFWRACATAASSRSPPLTRRSMRFSSISTTDTELGAKSARAVRGARPTGTHPIAGRA
jgi:hypothetical protein